jgi:autotransporter translocation and assembly factor TamB
VRRRAILLGAVGLIVAAIVVTRPPVLAALLPRVIALATGYDAQFAADFENGRVSLANVRVTRSGELVLTAARVDVAYSVRDLLPGSAHRFGLTAIRIDRPVLTLVRHKDGSYNITLPAAAPAGPEAPTPPNRVPIALTVTVRDGTVSVQAPDALDPQARHLAASGLTLDASIDTSARTHYTLSGSIAGSTLRGGGTIDVARGYAMHRATLGQLPIRPVADYFINSRAAQLLSGTARTIDVRAYALDVQPFQPVAYHLGGSADIAGASMHLTGLALPLLGIGGHVGVVDNVFYFNRIDASLARIPVVASGGIFDFTHPHFRFGITGHAQLAQLKKAFTFSSTRDIRGNAALAVEVDGPLGEPAISAQLNATDTSYAGVPLHDVHATMAYTNSTLYFLPVRSSAPGTDVAVRGALFFDEHTVHSEAAVHLRSNADRLPYAGEVLGPEPLIADAFIDGIDTNFYGYGALASERGIDRVAAVIHAGPTGQLDLAPFWVRTNDVTLSGGYHLDRHSDRSAFWLYAENITVHAPKVPAFLGNLLEIPSFDGHIDRLAIAAAGRSGNDAVWGGSLHAHHLTIANEPFDRLSTSFAGTLADAAASPVSAAGPWGTFDGGGAVSLHGIAMRGSYHGTLQGLEPFLSGVPARGSIDGTAAIAVTPGGLVIQGDNLALGNASIHGLPLSRATGTLTIRDGHLRVYSALGTVAGGAVVAAGPYDSGIALVAHNVDGAQLRSIGLPLDAGTVSAAGRLGEGAPLPTFNGGVTIASGRVQAYRVDGSALVALHARGARLDHVVGALNGTYAIASGTLGALDTGNPTYAMRADVPAGDIANALHTLDLPALASDGTFNAALDLGGAGVHPDARGRIGVPAGSVNGLPFIDATALLSANTTGVSVRDGHVLVGTTGVAFDAASRPRISALRINAPVANLEDFDNFFDTGDTLAGNGRVKAALISQAHRLATSADVDLRGFRYRNLPIGDTRASWSSAHNTVTGSIAIDSIGGSLRANGTIAAQPSLQWQHTLRDSRYDLTFDVDDLDLSTWMAAFDFPEVPITGKISADARVRGRFPHVQLNGTTTMDGGTLWRLPLESFDTQFSSHGDRLRLDSASLVAAGITATATGEAGFAPNDPVNLTLYLNSDDLPTLTWELSRRRVPVTGLFESTISIGGTFSKPTFNAAFDASDANVYGISVPLLFGSLRLAGGALELRNAGVQFEKGQVTIAGSLPLQISPFRIGPRSAPVSFDVAVNGLDPAIFDTIAGNGTMFGGSIDGAFGVGGTVAAPRVAGNFGITKGSYVSSFERTPITAITASLAFNRTSATVDAFSAKLGTGVLTGSAQFTLPSGVANTALNGGNGAGFTIHAAAKSAQLDFPQYGAGTIDAALALTRTPDEALAHLTGVVALENATIPFAAFVNGAAVATAADSGALPQLPLDFDLKLAAGKGVRVRGSGYGAGLDIGATGAVTLTGTFEQPDMSGKYTSTGGTLTYFDRAFKVQSAIVDFDKTEGLIPDLSATATTHIVTRDPSVAYGAADITLKVDGPVNALKLTFSSNPPGYTNDQILAMIAPFGGFLGRTNSIPGGGATAINGTPVYGALSPVPGAQSIGAPVSGISVGEEAFNILNAQFAAGLLSPLEGALSSGLGFESVDLTVDYYGNVGFTATRILGKTLNFVYSSSFGTQSRQSFGLQLLAGNGTSAQLNFYTFQGAQQLFQTPATGANPNQLTIGEPLQGSSGFSFTFQRSYW